MTWKKRQAWPVRLAILACFAWSTVVSAETDWSAETLLKGLSGGDKQACFTEKKYSPLLTQPLINKGKLEFRQPDYLMKHTLSPQVELFEASGSEVTLRTQSGEEHHLEIQDNAVVENFVTTLRAVLRGDFDSLNQGQYAVLLKGDAANWQLILKPQRTRLKKRIDRITLRGKHNQIDVFTFFEQNGNRSELWIHAKNDCL